MASNDITLRITCGGGTDLAITRNDELVAVQEYSPGLFTKVNFGRLTRKRIDQLKEYLDRLAIHAVE
jgi:hypothetical protein